MALASLDVCAQADLKVGATPGTPDAQPAVAVPTVRSAAARVRSAARAGTARVDNPPASTAEDFRVVINRYWSFVRRYPSSGFADNALWQAANLSARGVRSGSARTATSTARFSFFNGCAISIRTARFRPRRRPQIEQLETMAAGARPPTPRRSCAVGRQRRFARCIARCCRKSCASRSSSIAKCPSIRSAWKDPRALFFDLKGTKTVPSLVDATFRYDSDIVRHIRLGRHPNNTTRVVLDLENVGRYSVFTLYNPYRIVIDAERSAAALPRPTGPTLLTHGSSRRDGRAVRATGTSRTYSRPIARRARIRTHPVTRRCAGRSHRTRRTVLPAVPPRAARGQRVVPTVATPPIAPPLRAAAANRAVHRHPVRQLRPPAPVIAGKPIAPSANSSGKFSVARQLGLGVSRIVIDAGHGGHDPGASAFGISEAELVLDVTLRLESLAPAAARARRSCSRAARTISFRSKSGRRSPIASRRISFSRCTPTPARMPRRSGVETYFLNFALNPQAEAVAARENAASGKTMSSLPSIIKAITLNSKLNESRDFAAQRSTLAGARHAARQQDAERSRREAGALHGADWRRRCRACSPRFPS